MWASTSVSIPTIIVPRMITGRTPIRSDRRPKPQINSEPVHIRQDWAKLNSVRLQPNSLVMGMST